MKSNRTKFVRGKRMRITRTDMMGRPVYGPGSTVVTKGFVTAGYTTNVEEGEAVTSTNADGETCVNEPGTPSFNGFGLEIEFCDVDFAAFEILTGQEIVLNDDGTAVGITESTSVDLANVSFALEIWLGADAGEAALRSGSQGVFGYVLTPFLSGGVIGDVSVENGAINFTINNISTKNGARWGSGPYAVELVGGEPSTLSTPMKSRDHRRVMTVEVAPPRVHEGAIPLLDPTAPELTDLGAVVSGQTVTFTPDGSGLVFYELGDGVWDYSESGSYEYTYDEPGTYEVIASRGTSSITETVTVGA